MLLMSRNPLQDNNNKGETQQEGGIQTVNVSCLMSFSSFFF